MQGILWFDGACTGNPGPMGAGAVLEVGARRRSWSKAMGRGTNNEAEYHGLILGLHQAAAAGVTRVEVRGDSQLVLRQLLGRYKVRAENLAALHAAAQGALGRFEQVKLVWVPREENTEADQAAREAIV